MSTDVNTRLLERASEMIDYWAGTPHAKIIEKLIDANDLEELNVAVGRAEYEMFLIEYAPMGDC